MKDLVSNLDIWNMIYIAAVVAFITYKATKSVGKILDSNHDKYAIISINANKFYIFIFSPIKLILTFTANSLNLVIFPVIIISLISLATENKYFIYIFGFIIWQICATVNFLLLDYIAKFMFLVTAFFFKFDKVGDDSAEYTIAFYGEKFFQRTVLLQKDVKELTDLEIHSISSYQFRQLPFTDRIFERIYAIRNYYRENINLSPSDTETNIFLKKSNLWPGFVERAILHPSFEKFVLYFIYFCFVVHLHQQLVSFLI